MLTLKRLAIYLLTFFITVSLAMALINWKRLDNYLVNEANKTAGNETFVNREIVFINLEKPHSASEGASLAQYRRGIIQLLNTIAAESKSGKSPRGVVLDTWFSNDSTELENLQAALKQLKDRKVPVYAAYHVGATNGTSGLAETPFEEIDDLHASPVYNAWLAGSEEGQAGSGRYHTFFYPEKNVVNYENEIYLPSLMGDSVLVEALPVKVARDLSNTSYSPRRGGSVVPYRPLAEIENKTYRFVPDSSGPTGRFVAAGANAAPIDLNKTILVAGDATNDLVDVGGKEIPGPYLLTWALSNLLDHQARVMLPVENLYVIIGQLLFFSLFTVLVFALLYKYAKRLQTKPALIAVLAFLSGVLFLFLYGRLMLTFNAVIPAGHTLAAMLVAAVLCWRFAHKFLVTGVAEGSQKYDVFISYSHSQRNWVYKNVYEPLAAYRKPNGDKLSIFFDQKSIGIGEAFTAKYMWAIVDTKHFVAVMSEDYYGKNHCRNELDCAMKRHVEKLLKIEAIAFSFKAIPEAYNCINCIDITVNPHFIDTLKETLAADEQPVSPQGSKKP